MPSQDIEIAALRFLADDEFCSPMELMTVIELWGGDAAQAAALLDDWRQRGWVAMLPQGGDQPSLIQLTAAGYLVVEQRSAAG